MSRPTVLVCSTAITAHTLNATLPVQGLVHAGAEVLWCADADFREHVEAQGATHIPWTREGRAQQPPAPASGGWDAPLAAARLYQHHLVAGSAVRARQVMALIEHRNVDVVLADVLCLAAVLACDATGTPRVSLGDGPLAWPDELTPPFGTGLPPLAGAPGRHRNRTVRRVVNEVVFADALRALNSLRHDLGLWPVADPVASGVSRECHLQGGVPALEYPRERWPGFISFVGALGPGTGYGAPLPAALRRGDAARRPLALVTQGTLRVDDDELVDAACEALLGEGWEVLVAGMPLPARMHGSGRCRALPRLDLSDALPHVDLLIGNGGWTTTTLALAHGIPVVVCGSTEEKPDIGMRVRAAGAGVHIRRRRPSTTRLARAVRRVRWDPSVADAAHRVQRQFDALDARTVTADRVLSLAFGHPR